MKQDNYKVLMDRYKQYLPIYNKHNERLKSGTVSLFDIDEIYKDVTKMVRELFPIYCHYVTDEYRDLNLRPFYTEDKTLKEAYEDLRSLIFYSVYIDNFEIGVKLHNEDAIHDWGITMCFKSNNGNLYYHKLCYTFLTDLKGYVKSRDIQFDKIRKLMRKEKNNE